MAESPSDVFTKISNKEASAGQWMIVSFDAKKKLAVDATGEGNSEDDDFFGTFFEVILYRL